MADFSACVANRFWPSGSPVRDIGFITPAIAMIQVYVWGIGFITPAVAMVRIPLLCILISVQPVKNSLQHIYH